MRFGIPTFLTLSDVEMVVSKLPLAVIIIVSMIIC